MVPTKSKLPFRARTFSAARTGRACGRRVTRLCGTSGVHVWTTADNMPRTNRAATADNTWPVLYRGSAAASLVETLAQVAIGSSGDDF